MCQHCPTDARNDNPTSTGYWIQTILDCAREEKVSVPEATERVVLFITDEAIPLIMDTDPELKARAEATGIIPASTERVVAAIRRDGGLAELIVGAIRKLADALPQTESPTL